MRRVLVSLMTAGLLAVTAPAATSHSPEPAEPQLAYVAIDPDADDGSGETRSRVFTAAADGTDPVPVTPPPAFRFLTGAITRAAPAWSPDGRAFAYSTEVEGRTDVIVAYSGQLTDRITDAREPAWRADGARLAFIDVPHALGVSRPDGSHRRRIELPGGVVSAPQWSADGGALRVLVNSHDSFYGRVYEVPEEGGVARPLTEPQLSVRSFTTAADGSLVVVAQPVGSPSDFDDNDVFRADGSGGMTRIEAAGVAPTETVDAARLSPDGRRLALTVSDGSRNVRLRLVDLATGERRDTPLLVNRYVQGVYAYLVDWSADAQWLAVTVEVQEDFDRKAVEVIAADGSVHRAIGDPYSGGPDEEGPIRPRSAVYAPPSAAPLTRLEGASRFSTSAAVADATAPTSRTLVLARADDYADALAGAPLAAQLDAPLLLTGSDRLDDTAAAQVRRRDATRVVLLGGERALSPQVERDLEALGVDRVERVAGGDRFATAAALADRLDSRCEEAFVVLGGSEDPARGWPDAVAVSALAAVRGAPILLTGADQLPVATADVLEGCDSATVVGGPAAVSARVEEQVNALAPTTERLAGTDRYGTSAAVLEASGTVAQVWLATGANWPDALAAGPAAALSNGALLLVPGSSQDVPEPAATLLAGLRPQSLVAVGDAGVLSVPVTADAARHAAR